MKLVKDNVQLQLVVFEGQFHGHCPYCHVFPLFNDTRTLLAHMIRRHPWAEKLWV